MCVVGRRESRSRPIKRFESVDNKAAKKKKHFRGRGRHKKIVRIIPVDETNSAVPLQ